MTVASRSPLPRRAVLAGGLGVIGVGLAALPYGEWSKLLRPHYPPTPYDDLLSQMADRENAARLGAAVLADEKGFDARGTAQQLRTRLRNRLLADELSAELRAGRVKEVRGWILPESLAEICALAAKAS